MHVSAIGQIFQPPPNNNNNNPTAWMIHTLSNEIKKTFYEVAGAVLPLVAVIILAQVVLVRIPFETFVRFLIGSVLVLIGFTLFLQGAKTGLLSLGEMIGSQLAKQGSIIFLLSFAFILGFAITVADPDVQVLAIQASDVSPDIGKNVLVLSVALGVGIFVALALLRILLQVPIKYLIGAGYLVIMIMWPFTPKEFIPLAMDSGGVTTGPITVPFIMAIGLGVTSVLGGKSTLADSFGIVGLAAIGPIISVMLLGMVYS